jgi:hypothetical protein
MLAVLGRRAAAAAGVLPVLAQQSSRSISTSQPAADLRNFLDEADPMTAAHGALNQIVLSEVCKQLAVLQEMSQQQQQQSSLVAAGVRYSTMIAAMHTYQQILMRYAMCTVASVAFQMQQEQCA